MRDRAGGKEVVGEEEEERVEDKKEHNGREEEDGGEGGWRFLNVPLWSMKRRESNGQKHLRDGQRESD